MGDRTIAEPNCTFDKRMAFPQFIKEFDGKVITIDEWVKLQDFVLELANKQSTESYSEKINQYWNGILGGIVPRELRIVRPDPMKAIR